MCLTGTLPSLNDVIAGHIQLMFSDVPPAAGLIAGGKLHAIGVTTKARLPAFPDVPSISEAGVPNYDVAAWLMLVAPAKTPQPIVAKLHAELKTILAAPAFKEQLTKMSLQPIDTPSVDAMQTFVKSEIARWGQVVQQAGVARSE
jgi:tripartite-type tricarboxylate transporter receptor subunit TctC